MTDLRTRERLDSIRDRMRSTWPELTDNDIDEAQGNVEWLVATINQVTGESPENIRRTIEELLEANGDDGDDDGDGDGEGSRTHP